MNTEDHQHRLILERIAHRVMLERGLLPDFSQAVMKEVQEMTSPAVSTDHGVVRDLRALADARNPALEIEVDGGVKPDTAGKVAAAGANVLVAGTAVFGQKDYRAAIGATRAGAEAARR